MKLFGPRIGNPKEFVVPSDLDLENLSLRCCSRINRSTAGFQSVACLNKNQLRTYSSVSDYIHWLISKLTVQRIRNELDALEISSKELKLLYKEYNKVNKFLKEEKLIWISKEYLPKVISDDNRSRCKKFRLLKSVKSVKQISIEPKTETRLIDCAEKLIGSDKSEPKTAVHRYILKTLKEDLIVDYDSFSKETFDADPEKHEEIHGEILFYLKRIEKGVFNLHEAPTHKRLYYTLTSMPSDGRKFVKYKDGQEFVSRDICACHLYILISTYDENTPNIQELISGDIYQHLADESGMTREKIKEYCMFLCFGKVNKKTKFFKSFQKFFPGTTILIQGKKNKSEFSQEMFDSEAEFIIEDVGGKLMDLGVPFYSVHDCLYVPKKFEQLLEGAMKQTGKEGMKKYPRIA